VVPRKQRIQPAQKALTLNGTTPTEQRGRKQKGDILALQVNAGIPVPGATRVFKLNWASGGGLVDRR
jgi:hypothetical protein